MIFSEKDGDCLLFDNCLDFRCIPINFAYSLLYFYSSNFNAFDTKKQKVT